MRKKVVKAMLQLFEFIITITKHTSEGEVSAVTEKFLIGKCDVVMAVAASARV